MAMVEAPGAFTDFPMEQDDVVYPCKGCGEILEEGKAFELAGNRWHIDCFRCNTCGTLLDSDANLLLLGDGSLICNNCTYSCSACGNKIEDLAILTGDQAFCANCFKCRNCKRKIDNLRYARTSQGIFCMSCHETLMAKRRKNKKANRNPAPASNGLNKSLPDLPRGDIPLSAFSSTPDVETPPSEKYSDFVETPLEVSPRPRASKARKDGSIDKSPAVQREVSEDSLDDSNKETLTLPASTFQGSRESTQSKNSAISYDTANGDDFFGTVPLLLDTNQNASASPVSNGRVFAEAPVSQSNAKSPDSKGSSRDYFGRAQPSISSARDVIREAQRESSRSSSVERKQPSSPHIAYQQKGRQTSDHIADSVRRNKDTIVPANSPAVDRKSEAPITTSYPTPPSAHSEFKLQEAPKPRKSNSRRSSKGIDRSPVAVSPTTEPSHKSTPQVDDSLSTPPIGMDKSISTAQDFGSPDPSHAKGPSQTELPSVERPKRGDSLAATVSTKSSGSIPRKEVASASGPTTPNPPPTYPIERNRSLQSGRPQQHDVYQPTGRPRNSSKYAESPSSTSVDTINPPPPRASSRPNPGALEAVAAPRAPPPAPPIERHRATASTSTMQTDSTSRMSPVNLPRHSTGAEFSIEAEMERIMNGEEKQEQEPGTLRKLSNAVKHGRSFSDRGQRSASSSQKWSKSPLNGSIDISSPTSASSPDAREENILLKNKLRQAQERVAKLEVDKNRLQSMVDGSADISEVNTELKQKRSTMAFLDTQREIVVRELEVMTDHLRKAKESNSALDLNALQSSVLRDFGASLQKLKDAMRSQIEDLTQKRNDLTREIDDLIQMKDKGFQEYESLSSRNHQLTQHNNELISNIQGSMKAVAVPNNGTPIENQRPTPAPNGLGLYIQHNKERSESGSEVRTLMGSEYSNTNLLNDNESEGTVLATPQVVKIGGKGKPNMLKKGTQGFVKGLRNIRRDIASERDRGVQERNNNGQWVEGTPYDQISVQGNSNGGSSLNISRPYQDPNGKQKFGGFFASEKDRGNLKHLKSSHNNSSHNLTSPDVAASSQLFGSDLGARCEFEKRVIPCIVSRCIEEVELRGMDVEGIYRKSGGSGQVNTVRLGFEKDNDYDISEPELDIHAVTSTLKQYFRRLPVPLITFDVYDQLLEASRVEEVDKRALAMRDAVNTLPKSHKDCLEFLVFHLAKVMSQESENLMTPLNLAVVFAPTIMRPQSIEREMTDMQAQRIAVQSLLEMNQIIFGYDS